MGRAGLESTRHRHAAPSSLVDVMGHSLGAPRLHHTINTGEVISKESAAEYALSEFDSRWHPIIEEGLAYRTGKPRDPSLGTPTRSLRCAAEFVLHVVESAHRAAA
ncbi:MAG TPA: DUF4111 domain-containing protein [Myxococcales bacterium]|nr:DUF4111 domain-containing protein [Myxococcales bacterium]